MSLLAKVLAFRRPSLEPTRIASPGRRAWERFPGTKIGALRRSDFQATWRRGIKAPDLTERFRLHNLRHVGSGWAAGTGANPRKLMKRTGHRSTSAPLIYLPAARAGDRLIAAGIERHLRGSTDNEDPGPDG